MAARMQISGGRPGLGLLVAVLALGSTGAWCKGPGSRPDADISGAVVELGTGTVDYEPLQDGQPLILWYGPQGGHHFIVHARIQGMEPGDPTTPGLPENPRTRFSAFDEAGVQVDLQLPPYALGYRDHGDEWRYLPSGRLLRTDEPLVPPLFGNRVRIRVEVRDERGRVATDEGWVVAVREPLPPDAGVADADVADADVADADVTDAAR